MNVFKYLQFLVLLVCALCIGYVDTSFNMLKADDVVTLALGLPDYLIGDISNKLVGDFESKHAGVKVVIVPVNDRAKPLTTRNLNEHFDDVEQFVTKADVLFVDDLNNMSVEATQAGYFLNMMPIANSDVTLDPKDFFSSIWNSYQWNDGLWAIPFNASFQMLVFRPTAFDAANLAYPNENWTIDDFALAASQLTQYDHDNEVSIPGISISGYQTLLFRSLLSRGFYNQFTVPNQPEIFDQELIRIFQVWRSIEQSNYTRPPLGETDSDQVALRIEHPQSIYKAQVDNLHDFAVALLPGGIAGLKVRAFALSGATAHPEHAYELIKFISSGEYWSGVFPDSLPARRSLMDATGQFGESFASKLTTNGAEVVRQALDKALPLSELRYSNYIMEAYHHEIDPINTMDFENTLQQIQQEALNNFIVSSSDDKNVRGVISVTTFPSPGSSLQDNPVKFGVFTYSSDLDPRWRDLIIEYERNYVNNRFIRLIKIDSLQEINGELDCFYTPFNYMGMAHPELLLPLSPFLDADPTFLEEDMLENLLVQVTKDNQVLGMPTVIYPNLLRYNRNLFSVANIVEPNAPMTIDEFNRLLISMQEALNSETPIYVSGGHDDTFIFMLATAYGEKVIDYTTQPTMFNLDRPGAVEALEQVLNLIKQGLIAYQPLNSPPYNYDLSKVVFTSGDIDDNDIARQTDDSGWGITTFPIGTDYTPVAYTVGVSYILKESKRASECYQWIKYLLSRPDIFWGMPVLRSVLTDPSATVLRSPEINRFYSEFAHFIDKSNTVVFPSEFHGPPIIRASSAIEYRWIKEAFDDYIFNDAELDIVLMNAQSNILEFRSCISRIDVLLSPTEVSKQTNQCIISVDPDKSSLLGR